VLKFVGAVVLLTAVLGPVLLEFGALENAGLFRELIELEVRAFSYVRDAILQIYQDLFNSSHHT
jgi:hypothetical protein